MHTHSPLPPPPTLSVSLSLTHTHTNTKKTQDEDARKRTREMEMVWRASTSLSPPQGDVFTVHFAQGNHSGLSYGWLPGFNWEWGLGGDDPIQVCVFGCVCGVGVVWWVYVG